MIRPKKRKALPNSLSHPAKRFESGYNNCCDEYEKFLPDENELYDIIIMNTRFKNLDFLQNKKLARAISKRLRGEK